MDSQDGEVFIKTLASFVRTNERSLANIHQSRRPGTARHGASQSVSSITAPRSPTSPAPERRPATSASNVTSSLVSGLSSPLAFAAQTTKTTQLQLTPHHLFYLLSRFEELGVNVGPMKVRLESLHDTSTATNYVSFLNPSQRTKSRGSDAGSIRSISSIRSVVSGMSAIFSAFGLGSTISAARNEKQKAAIQADLKQLYSAFTKLPCLKLAPDWQAKLVRGYEEFPFDSAVPLYVFKNLQYLEISGIDYRQFFGWDRLAEQLKSLSLNRASIEDPAEILIDIVLDDMDKRRRRSAKMQSTSPTSAQTQVLQTRRPLVASQSFGDPFPASYQSMSLPGSPEPRRGSVGDILVSPLMHETTTATPRMDRRRQSLGRIELHDSRADGAHRPRSNSPQRPSTSRHTTANSRNNYKVKRSGSGSSQSSMSDSWHNPRHSASNLIASGFVPANKWRFLRHLSLADNSLTTVSAVSLIPLSETLWSFDLSTNLFTQIPDSLATLTALRALNLSHCMIDSLHSLLRNPLPAITALNLRANRLQSIAGVEKLYPLERLDLRDNRITDPTELARLTGIPDLREIWVEGNPFTRTHRNYRITIFNLFRETPGFTEDIIIDSTGPSYSEKKYLKERAAVPAAVPVMKQPVPEIPAVDVSKPAIIQEAVAKDQSALRKERLARPTPRAVESEINTSSTRRRRTPKRRIVDLATNDHPTITMVPGQSEHLDNAEDALAPAAVISSSYGASHSSPPEVAAAVEPLAASIAKPTPKANDAPRINTSVLPNLAQLSKPEPSPAWNDQEQWDMSGEVYRRKIEALRGTVGSGYLTVLNEEVWDPARAPAFGQSPFGARTGSAPPVHSGRTLG
ncbi:leucine rich repeat domain-containing protein [Microdochium trichocladiopsis]|uniref:Leucine rich repeat domain-containing protein n=1 Tax=Microdochium trichocladiopsis TaxID=1682393 RepID=A0A9P9BUD0_9PEZI|nr:leucine rich repeat domain-containing protein [Microdochium trichocladiopsis]KAH7037992.1 leucine rich repeat domain-containing protein [Microdochium trichocladiopsis]